MIVCSLDCLNTMLRLLAGPNLGMVVWAPAGLNKTLFLSDILNSSSWGLLSWLSQPKISVPQHSYAAVCSLYFLSTAVCLSITHLVYCASRSLLHGQLILMAFSSNGRWVPPLPVAIGRTSLCIKFLEVWCPIASGQCHTTGSLVLPAGVLLRPSGVWWQPAGRQDRNTKQVLGTPTFIWVHIVIAGSRRYCPLLCWLSCAARAITGFSDCHWLACSPLNLAADTT